ncbi:MAG TPA: ImmA/IrrE family metallo-endopeptidase [Bauldia sp.]
MWFYNWLFLNPWHRENAVMGRDYKFYFRSEELIAEDASRLLAKLGLRGATYFNICDFIEHQLGPWLRSNGKEELTIRLFDASPGENLAFVSFDNGNPILNIDTSVWEEAKIGEPSARYVLAHEIGHVVLHAHYDLAYSADPALKLAPFQQEESAEWQAHTFARHFLVPVETAKSYDAVGSVATKFGVSIEVATSQFNLAHPRRKPDLGAIVCETCGGFVVTRDGKPDRCKGCAAKP